MSAEHNQQDDLIPADDITDDRNTVEGQLTGKGSASRGSKFLTLQLQKYLSDAAYPATRQQLHDHAKARGAGIEVLAAIKNFREPNYQTYAHVSGELTRKGSH